MKRLLSILLAIVIPLACIASEEELLEQIKRLKSAMRVMLDRIELLELTTSINDEQGEMEDRLPEDFGLDYEQWLPDASNDYATLVYSTTATNWVVNTNAANGLTYQVWQIGTNGTRFFDYVRATAN